MRFLVALVGALLGGLLGILAGIAVTAVMVLTADENPRNPGAQSAALLSLLLTVPGGLLFGVIQGIRFAISRFDRRQHD